MLARYRRVWMPALWAFFLVLTGVGLAGVFQSLRQIQQRHRQSLHTLYTLQFFQSSLSRLELLMVGYASSESTVARTAVYNPRQLRESLELELAQADQIARRLYDQLENWEHASNLPEFYWQWTRVRQEWARTESIPREFLAVSEHAKPNLSTLRVFRHNGQDNLQNALTDLHRSLESLALQNIEKAYRELWDYFACAILGLCGIAVLLYGRWIAPAVRLRLWLTTKRGVSQPFACEYDCAVHSLEELEERLRQAEQFMRDLSMGRTPQPILAKGSGDALARSSYWLLQRIEEYRRKAHQREAV